FMCESAGDISIAELPLSINIAIEFVGVPRQCWVIAIDRRPVIHTCGTRPRNDRLQSANLALLESIRGLPEIVGKSPGKRQFVQWVNPVGPEVIELPVCVRVRLLERIVCTHAHIKGYNVGRTIRK